MNGTGSSSPDWDNFARSGLAGVLDPTDVAGGKNQLVDRAQKRAILQHAGVVKGLQILDFGCGNGRLSSWLAQRGATVHGVDTSQEMVAEARKNVPAARFDVISPEGVTIEHSAYDLVIIVGVFYLLTEPQRVQILKEMRLALRPGGRILALEKVSDGTFGQGWTLEQNVRCFERAGLALREPAVVRLGFSSIIGVVQRRPYLARLPMMPSLLQAEAKRNVPKGFAGGQYADYVFVASPVGHSPS